jgi:hypothetical protein
MPNRKTFDPREKYDHSSRPLEHAKKNDLKPDVSEESPEMEASGVDSPARKERGDRAGRRGDKPPAGR